MELTNIDQHLLATKLTIPPIYHDKIISRQRLYKPLDRGVQCPILLVSAPAGFGKTTLVAEWLRHKKLLAAWVSLEKADNELMRFWRYVIAALGCQYDAIRQQIEISPVGMFASTLTSEGAVGTRRGSGLSLPACADPAPPFPEAIPTALINALHDLAEGVILIIDDYQAITDTAIHQSMKFFLEHLPPRLHLLMITRSDPPLGLARLRVQDKLAEIRAADLRLTADETRVFLNQIMDLSLTDQQVADLCKRTEGWIAGIQLVALSLTGRDDVSNVQHFIDTFTSKNIVGTGLAPVRPLKEHEVPLIEMLSEREYSVLRLVSEGLSNQEIAHALVLTVSTIKTHLNNIYAKFQVHTRLQAVTKAYDLGLLSPWAEVSPRGGETRNVPLN